MEDCRHRGQRGKVEEAPGYLFVVLKQIHWLEDDELAFDDLDVFLGRDWVITVCEGDGEKNRQALDGIRSATESSDAAQVFYRICDTVIDSYIPVTDCVDDVIDGLEEQVLEDAGPDVLARIFRIRRALIELRRILSDTRDVTAHLYRVSHELIPRDLIPFLRDLYDHVTRQLDLVETRRDLLTGAMDVYLSTVANRTNQTMKVLTVVSTFALPALIISGFFGMNLKDLPFAESSHGVEIVTGLMAAATALLLLVLRGHWR